MNNITVYKVAFALMVIGGLNWLLIGLFETNAVAELGLPNGIERLIYVLVGLSTLFVLWVRLDKRR